MDENDLAHEVIGSAIEVHRALGPGLLESAYQNCLVHELGLRGLSVETEVMIPIEYKGLLVGEAYRADLLIENKLIVELKSVESVSDVHKAQLLTYLRLTQRKLGLMINFNTALVKDGILRIVNNLYNFAPQRLRALCVKVRN
jgi:GxxExxY protein